MIDQVRPGYRDMQFMGLVDQIHLEHPDLSKIISRYIDKIQNNLQSKEAKNLSKQATGETSNFIMAFKNKGFSVKRKATNEDKYYNCHKFGHFGQDCFFPDTRLNRINTQQSYRDDLHRGDSRRKRAQRRGCNERRSDTPNRAH